MLVAISYGHLMLTLRILIAAFSVSSLDVLTPSNGQK